MAKMKTYLRVARMRKGFRVQASARPNYEPLEGQENYGKKHALPTVAFALELNIPDTLFEQAEHVVATINVDEDKVKIAGKIASA